MDKPDFDFQNIPYSRLKDGFRVAHDPYGIVMHEQEYRGPIFMQNPNLTDFDKPYMYVGYADDVPVARCFYHETRVKLGEEIKPALSGSALSVVKEFRQYALGADVVLHNTFRDDYAFKLFAGTSAMALPLFKKLKYHVFIIPRYILRYNCKSKLRQKGLRGLLLDVLAPIANLWWRRKYSLHQAKRQLKRRYSVSKCDIVPEWVDDIVLKDGHPYMEVHDHRWLQWNLTGCFSGGEGKFQSFYAIYENAVPVGFFLTKQRIIDARHHVVSCGVYEWGSADEKRLSEADIYELAIDTFPKDTYIIDVGTVSTQTIERISRLGFEHSSDENVVFYGDKKQYKDIGDADKWRLRLGYADTIFF